MTHQDNVRGVHRHKIEPSLTIQQHEDASKPRVGIFYRGGAMSSAGELTGVAAFEVMKRLGPQVVGMGCSDVATRTTYAQGYHGADGASAIGIAAG